MGTCVLCDLECIKAFACACSVGKIGSLGEPCRALHAKVGSGRAASGLREFEKLLEGRPLFGALNTRMNNMFRHESTRMHIRKILTSMRSLYGASCTLLPGGGVATLRSMSSSSSSREPETRSSSMLPCWRATVQASIEQASNAMYGEQGFIGREDAEVSQTLVNWGSLGVRRALALVRRDCRDSAETGTNNTSRGSQGQTY